MILVVQNRSTKKAFRRTKRIISALLPPISNRLNLGDVPKRVVLELVKNLRNATTKGTSVKLFFGDVEGYRGFKCIEFGTKTPALADFVNVNSKLDIDLLARGLLAFPSGSSAAKKRIQPLKLESAKNVESNQQLSDSDFSKGE